MHELNHNREEYLDGKKCILIDPLNYEPLPKEDIEFFNKKDHEDDIREDGLPIILDVLYFNKSSRGLNLKFLDTIVFKKGYTAYFAFNTLKNTVNFLNKIPKEKINIWNKKAHVASSSIEHIIKKEKKVSIRG